MFTCDPGVYGREYFGKWNTIGFVIHSSVPQIPMLTKSLFLRQAMTAFASALLIRTACKDPTVLVMDNSLHILHNCAKPYNTMVNGMRLYQYSVDEYGKL
jgi:hypothetical protein